MSSKTFYVLNRENNVYVCIDNNGGLASTQEPTGTDTSDITLGDNYVWKFLYSVPSNKPKFLDETTIPIVELKIMKMRLHLTKTQDNFNIQHKKTL